MIKLPGLIDIHVHLREPGAVHKEDFSSGTAAALAGGITTVLAMPNTDPPLVNREAFQLALQAAAQKAHCDYAVYLGAGEQNAEDAARLSPAAAGLKMYLDATYGPLLLDSIQTWSEHFQTWPINRPLVAHAERRTLAAYLFLGALYQRPVHVCHVSRKEEIELIRKAKESGFQITCEVTPHHLFLTEEDLQSIGLGRGEVRPVLATKMDQQALWENLEVIDCFATDHAPHTLEEKDGENPPPGFPGLETMLPLLLTAVKEGRLTLEDLITRLVENPRKIFALPETDRTWIEVDETHSYLVEGELLQTRCGWTPFEGFRVQGLVRKVVQRGKTVYQDGQVLARPGAGINCREL